MNNRWFLGGILVTFIICLRSCKKKLPISAAYRELKHYSLAKYIPLFIDYQTVYLSADNKLRYCEDIYKYDPSLLEAMNDLRLKP